MENRVFKLICCENEYDVSTQILIKSTYFKSKIERWSDSTNKINVVAEFSDVILDYIKYLKDPMHIPDKHLWESFKDCVSFYGSNNNNNQRSTTTIENYPMKEFGRNSIKINGKKLQIKKFVIHNSTSEQFPTNKIIVCFRMDYIYIHKYILNTEYIGMTNGPRASELEDYILDKINFKLIMDGSPLRIDVEYTNIEKDYWTGDKYAPPEINISIMYDSISDL